MFNVGAVVSDLIGNALGSAAVVVIEKECLAGTFTRIRLSGQTLKSAKWTPGDKLQVRPRHGSLQVRTYTPFAWNGQRGTCDLLAFAHGEGPAARWFGTVAVQSGCEIFGPNKSIDLTTVTDDVHFVGDETSVALAVALRELHPTAKLSFECVDTTRLGAALQGLSLDPDGIDIVRKSDDRSALLDQLRRSGSVGCQLIGSGDAATIAAIRRITKTWPEPRPRILARAYWSAGRAGMS